MPAIDNLVSISITNATAAVPQASFSIPLIVGPTASTWGGTDYVHAYTAPAGMLTDGFTAGSPEYTEALAMYSQPVTPSTFLVGKRSTAVAQVDTLAVNTVTVSHVYRVTVNGTQYSYTAVGGDTQQVILAALNTLIVAGGAVTGAVTGTGASALLTLTSAAPGAAVTYSAVDTLLTKASVTPNNGIAGDLANISAQNNSWYGLAINAATDADITQAAAYIEGVKKIFLAVTSTTAVSGAATTDVGSVLQGKAYKRTAIAYSPANVGAGFASAWLGGQLPLTPGSNNWAYKTLAGQTADTLTATQVATCIGNPIAGTAGKNVNVYQTVGGVNITQMGVMAGGQYIDITVGLDWLQSTLQTNIFAALVNAKKLPYTDAGASVLISAVRSGIDLGVSNGLIDGTSTISVTAPAVATVPTNQRANRIAPPISFVCRVQGAFNSVSVAGTVNV